MKSNADWRFCPALPCDRPSESGFTLVELLVTMCVSLMLLGGVVSLFGSLGESVNDSKSNGEMLQTMRHTAKQLQADLGNVSVVPDPAQTMINPQGFFEYVEGPYNDARLDLGGGGGGEPTEAITIDDGDAGFEATSKFNLFTNTNIAPNMYGGDNHNAQYNPAGGEATWTFTELPAGEYQVATHWDHKYNNNYNDQAAAFTILDGTAAVGTATVNQKNAPNEFEADGYWWNTLETVDISSGTLVVKLERGPVVGRATVADAIRIQCLDCGGGGGGGGETALNLVGDCDDVLHFTTKTDEGAHEVVWFLTPMAGHENKPATDKRYRLHRYTLEINPSEQAGTSGVSQGWNEDSSDRQSNSLNSLALRKNRWAHRPESEFTAIPNEQKNNNFTYKKELAIVFRPDDMNRDAAIDHVTSTEWDEVLWPNAGKTVILENVIGFDVQAYDPKVPIYSTPTSDGQTVSLLPSDPGWTVAHNNAVQAYVNQGLDSIFDLDPPPTDVGPIGMGAFRDLDSTQSDDTNSPLQTLNTANGSVATYDSWSGDYVKNGDVGFDNDADNIVDTAEDLRQSPPYDAPLKAVQVEIRMQEPESGKVRSVKVRKYLGKR